MAAQPQTSVAFLAFYSDNKDGSPKPTGAGYGGNEGAMMDATGTHTFIWTVSGNAPLGPGRVDVYGSDDKYTGLPFRVAQSC